MKFIIKPNSFEIFIKNIFFMITMIILFLFLGCKSVQTENNTKNTISKIHINIPIQEHSINSVLWQQLSGEYQALTFQAFNFAKYQLDIILDNEGSPEKPLAIVTDIDETILNNSPFFAKMIELDEGFSKQKWIEWGKQKNANPIPGALDFFRYAESKNIEVFYISNRYDSQLNETIENMKKVGFPYSNKEHIILKKDISGKEPRRMKVEKTHKIIMLLGDNLSDFSSVFDNCSTKERNSFVDSLRTSFGEKFIVIPNPIYGNWETSGLYENNYSWTPIEKDSIRRSKLISY